jgi:hypothetical protein
MPDIFDEIKEWLEEFQAQQKAQKKELLPSREEVARLLQSPGGERFLQGGRNVAAGAEGLNLGLRSIPLFLNSIFQHQRRAPDMLRDFFSRDFVPPGTGAPGGVAAPSRPFFDLPPGFPVSKRRDVPVPGGPFDPSFNPPTGQIPDASHLLFSGGLGRNEKEGKIKDMERDLAIQEKMEKLQERLSQRNTVPPKGAEFTNRR